VVKERLQRGIHLTTMVNTTKSEVLNMKKLSRSLFRSHSSHTHTVNSLRWVKIVNTLMFIEFDPIYLVFGVPPFIQ